MNKLTPEDHSSAVASTAELGVALHDEAIHITGLCETLCNMSLETISMEYFNDAQNLSWSYKCLAKLANELAEKLSDVAP